MKKGVKIWNEALNLLHAEEEKLKKQTQGRCRPETLRPCAGPKIFKISLFGVSMAQRTTTTLINLSIRPYTVVILSVNTTTTK